MWKFLKRDRSSSTQAPSDAEEQAEPMEEIVVPIEDFLDLHTFRPAEVKDLLDDYLEAACEKGFQEVRIIHGKGTGVLRERVHAILRKHPLVSSFRQAEEQRGGWGATMVALRCKYG
jgi:dsDNA-specific endonuclease/ATPase MutS2